MYVDAIGTTLSGSGHRVDICLIRTKINSQFFINGPQCVNNDVAHFGYPYVVLSLWLYLYHVGRMWYLIWIQS